MKLWDEALRRKKKETSFLIATEVKESNKVYLPYVIDLFNQDKQNEMIVMCLIWM